MNRRLIIGMVCLLLLLCTQISFAGERYKWLDSSETTTYSFDTETIMFAKKWDNTVDTSIIDVWFKLTYNEAGVNEEIALTKKAGLSTDGWEKLQQVKDHYQFNIKISQFKLLESYFYDINGNVLYKEIDKSSNWNNVIPGTYSESLLKGLKAYVTENWTTIYNRSK